MSGASVGIDVGGTFTDLVAIDPAGAVRAHKVLSTPADQSAGVEAALAALGATSGSVGRVVHGTTVATNILLERRGARVVLCATAGATDLLELRRQERASLYDLSVQHAPALVAPPDVVGVPERIDPAGVRKSLDAAAADAVAADVAARAPTAVAVALLHAYADARHEELVARALHDRLDGVPVALSSDVLPEIREYERTATTVAEAYLRPGVAGYLGRLAERLRAGGYPAPHVMTSSGGMRSAGSAARSAASLALSGPAGGVVGAALVARASGIDRALTIDIGGTSADVGLIIDGAPLVEPGGEVAGVPIALPRVLVETVSAGGGSVAWVDGGGALRVGPRSAGVSPGPVAFGRGGEEPTVTDAHLSLDNIGADSISGGIRLDVAAAARALAALAARLDAPAARVAEAVIAIADAAMARALRRVSVERGIDPRSCALVAFGGGGPLHACGLADRLGMTRIVVPPFAGVLSALGLAVAPERAESMASVMRSAEALGESELRGILEGLAAGSPADARSEWWLRARYRGQGHELDVPVSPGDDGASIAERFAAVHRGRFGYVLRGAVELVSARHAASGAMRRVALARGAPGRWSDAAMIDEGGTLDGVVVTGPATVALADATMRVAAGWRARPLALGGWELDRLS